MRLQLRQKTEQHRGCLSYSFRYNSWPGPLGRTAKRAFRVCRPSAIAAEGRLPQNRLLGADEPSGAESGSVNTNGRASVFPPQWRNVRGPLGRVYDTHPITNAGKVRACFVSSGQSDVGLKPLLPNGPQVAVPARAADYIVGATAAVLSQRGEQRRPSADTKTRSTPALV